MPIDERPPSLAEMSFMGKFAQHLEDYAALPTIAEASKPKKKATRSISIPEERPPPNHTSWADDSLLHDVELDDSELPRSRLAAEAEEARSRLMAQRPGTSVHSSRVTFDDGSRSN